MAWTTPVNVSTGSVLTATDYNQQVLGNLNELRAIHVGGIQRFMANNNTFSNQTTYADFPNATDKAAMDLTFVKSSSDTALLVSIDASLSFDSGAGQLMTLGLSIGGTDYDVARYQFDGAVNRRPFSGQRIITGVAAGSLAVKPRFKAAGASAVVFYANSDYVHYSLLEVRA